MSAHLSCRDEQNKPDGQPPPTHPEAAEHQEGPQRGRKRDGAPDALAAPPLSRGLDQMLSVPGGRAPSLSELLFGGADAGRPLADVLKPGSGPAAENPAEMTESVAERRTVDQTGTGGGSGSGTTGGATAGTGAGGTAAASPATVSFARVNAASTPAGMGVDRIPPRVAQAIAVTVTGWHAPMTPLEISVDGSGGAAGTVTVNGAATVSMSANGTIQLLGTVQTAVGSAGRLHLIAKLGGTEVGRGNAFSVASIPQDVHVSLNSVLTGARRGFAVNTWMESDSGTVGDLDQAQWSELVQYVSSTGVFSGMGAQNSGYLPCIGTYTDTHSTPTSALTGTGSRVANQTFKFLDRRSGVTDIAMAHSGFKITRNVTAAGGGSGAAPALQITTEKHGEAVTANGIASTAGHGSASSTQAV